MEMTHSFEGTTLALQHYYDISAISRRLPLLTVYQAREQPFGRQMAVWMAAYGDDIPVSEKTHRQLDDILLQNRAVTNPHVLRVLDYGTSEGHSFVVTDALDAGTVTLRDYLRGRGPLENWQVLRLIEQLTAIINDAHRVGFHDLCLTSDIIYVRDEKRFDLVTGPLGIGLHRSDILKIHNESISPDLMRHIPPWEYARNTDASLQSAEIPAGLAPGSSDDSVADHSVQNDDAGANQDDASKDHADDSIQDLSNAVSAVVPSDSDSITMTPAGFCSDVYNLAALTYEALSGQHPCFNEDLSDAVLTLTQGNIVELDNLIEISTDLNAVVMNTLKSPAENSEIQFLRTFGEYCSEDDRLRARQAEKTYEEPPVSQKSARRKRRAGTKIQHPLRWLAVILLLFMAGTAFVTWKIARVYRPVDLFALPEIVPVVPDGVDVVIASRTSVPDIHIYLTSMADGSLILLGDLPYIHRKQAVGTKLNFVVADDHGHSMQVPVQVNSKTGMMMVPVDLNW